LNLYAKRRKALMQSMTENSIAIIPANREYLRNGKDNYYAFRQDSDFYYLTGFTEPEALAILIPNREQGEFILFTRPRDKTAERWTGPRVGPEGAIEQFGADEAFSIDTIEEKMLLLLANRDTCYYAFGKRPDFERQLEAWLNQVRAQIRKGINAPQDMKNVEAIIHALRLIKSEEEIALMCKACEISALGHVHAMQACKPGLNESALHATLLHTFYQHQCQDVAYTPIVAAGANACVLHYIANNADINENDLVLIDAGGEYQHYAADITRTFPANGRFSGECKAIYELVLAAQVAAIDEAQAGNAWITMQETILKILCQGLVDLGILSGNVDDLIEQRAFEPFYMHLSGHWLGLDVHDVGDYKVDGAWRPLEAGMVLTVEPGLYIAPDNNDVDPRFRGIGVRIEDDILITHAKADVLSKDVPKEIDDIEALMS